MNKTLLIIRVVFVIVCAVSGWLLNMVAPEGSDHPVASVVVGTLIGVLTVLVDVLLKGFSLRGLSAVSFGLGAGSLIAFLLGSSPLFSVGDPQLMYLARLALFVICSYLGTVIALRGKDEFQLIIPYVRFVPHEVDVPLVVVDTSALIDGRIVKIKQSHFLPSALVVPEFVIHELQGIADSRDPARSTRGHKGLDTLNRLRALPNSDIRVVESDVSKGTTPEDKLLFLAQSMKARLLTTDYTLAQRAQFVGVEWLNINTLAKSLHTEVQAGDRLPVELVKPGREVGQAVGYLPDGSMVVVDGGATSIGKTVEIEVASIVPSGAGKLVFGRPLEKR